MTPRPGLLSLGEGEFVQEGKGGEDCAPVICRDIANGAGGKGKPERRYWTLKEYRTELESKIADERRILPITGGG